ncbi:MAG: DNA primase [Bacteroidetes bacterium GWF2_49_14]|nr:MAG: DNA primase [Bacteroidetes bacterium GWF2_49_14]HBB91250.1 DNA primase [Bacteroidales bacterium]
MIDYATIERILQVAEITDVVGDFVSLKRRGVNFLGLCPFHNEKTPSFTVSPSKGIFKCFGCGKGGNSVNFLMEHEHLSYPEALKWLAKKYHIEVAETEETAEEIAQKNDRESMMILTEFARKYYHRILLETEEGTSVGLSYFKERGFRREIIDKFELGYSLEQRDAFVKEALKSGYKKDYLEKTGLGIDRNDHLFDRFAGRVMFPIHNLAGRVIGFGGRILRSDAQAAKYLNSPESEIYHKSATLYGIYQARNAVVREDKCILVEGYTDVLSMHQAGIENVVASSGTSLTEDQIRLIKRFTPNVTILYDGDSAGIKASLRGIDMVLEQGMHVRVVPLPEGEDPDSFARTHSSTDLLQYLKENETDFITFKTKLLLKDSGKDPVKRAQLIQEVVRSVSVVPDRIERTVYLQECSRLLGVEEQILFTEAARMKRKQWEQKRGGGSYASEPHYTSPRQTPQVAAPDKGTALFETEEREIIRLMLNYSDKKVYDLAGEKRGELVPVSVGEFFLQEMETDGLIPENPLYAKVFREFQSIWGREDIRLQTYFTNHQDPEISQLAVDLLTPGHQISKIHEKGGAYVRTEEQMLKDIAPETLSSYRSKKVKQMIAEIDEQIRVIQGSEDDHLIGELLENRRQLEELRKAFSRELRRLII